MNETKSTEQIEAEAEVETDTEALIRFAYRRKALGGPHTMSP